jgi:3-oxoacyl-[acyl-carrier-protein] synthase-3
MQSSKIAGIGYYVPKNVYTNDDLSRFMETNDEWIQERTGIKERRFADRFGETTTTMGVEAAKIAIERAGITAQDVDFIIFATLSPDYYFPGCGVLLQREMKMREIGALDVRNQCSGFLYALSIADQFIKTGMYKNILVVGSEKHSFAMDFETRSRNVSVIFGDGAGAVVLQPTQKEGQGILSTHLHSDGADAEILAMFYPGAAANKWLPEVIKEALAANNLKPADIDLLVPHQANLRISQYVQQLLGLSDDQVFNNIQKYGNTTAASVPIALCEAWEAGKIKEGDLICLAAFGSGFTWASALIRW